MKKAVILSVSAVLLLSGCGTYAGSGAYAGASLGGLIGSAIGGISGGPRGSDIGSLIGIAGGAMVGGAMGAQADNAAEQKAAQERAEFSQRYQQHRSAATSGNNNDSSYKGGNYNNGTAADDSGFDPTGSGDDTLYDFNSTDYTGDYSATTPENVTPSVHYDNIGAKPATPTRPLEIRNARFVDDNQDHRLNGGELGKVIFEVYNKSAEPVYDIQPMVVETSGNKQIMVSGSIHVEKIEPGKGIRYTAMVKANNRIKDGNATFRVYAVQGNNNEASNITEFNITTSRK